jgi:hypothetical protein
MLYRLDNTNNRDTFDAYDADGTRLCWDCRERNDNRGNYYCYQCGGRIHMMCAFPDEEARPIETCADCLDYD